MFQSNTMLELLITGLYISKSLFISFEGHRNTFLQKQLTACRPLRNQTNFCIVSKKIQISIQHYEWIIDYCALNLKINLDIRAFRNTPKFSNRLGHLDSGSHPWKDYPWIFSDFLGRIFLTEKNEEYNLIPNYSKNWSIQKVNMFLSIDAKFHADSKNV